MKSLFNVQNKKLLMFLTVLFWGAIWGITEASLGTILHLPAFKAMGNFMKTSVIILPLAYCFMANCFKRTGTLRSIIYMGLVAASIKLTSAFFVGWTDHVYKPAAYIVLESASMMGALAIFRPTKVCSLKTFAAIVVANTTYQLTYLTVDTLSGSINAFGSMENWVSTGEKYLFTLNGIAILYAFVGGCIGYGINKFLEYKKIETKIDISKIVYSPIVASLAVVLAVTLTIVLK